MSYPERFQEIREAYERLMVLYLLVKEASMQQGGDEIETLAEKVAQLAPDLADGEEPPDASEAYDLLEDDRFSELTKYTVEVLALLDDTNFPGESFEQYMEFMQMDITICNLEIWPKQRKELELMRSEYPALYEWGEPLWNILKESKGQKAFMMDSIMAEYARASRTYDCGRYFEFYPNKRQSMDQVQWDSQESGTYMRQGKKTGRNDPYPCGSGKKYKNCCGKGV